MRTTRSLPLTISITLALTTAMPQARPATADATDHGSNFEQAMGAYSGGQFDMAEAKLQLAAAQGHATAHEILGFMYAIGPRLYRDIARDPDDSRATRRTRRCPHREAAVPASVIPNGQSARPGAAVGRNARFISLPLALRGNGASTIDQVSGTL